MSTNTKASKNAHIVILTGAGVSAESGIPTFRGPGGLWEGRDITELATPQAFRAQPHVVQRFYNERRQVLLSKEPNAAHKAIARLQKEYSGRVTLISQNIDDLHERGGSPEVWHIHGELLKSRCTHCGAIHECRHDLDQASVCPACHSTGKLRPHVVWFGETPLFLEELDARTRNATLFAAIGTSGLVYPAANFVHIARSRGARCIEFNLESSDGVFDEFIPGPATQTVTAWVDSLLRHTH
ncbi:MAG: NAD-dependent deacylase [Verrucomicrobiaceae bacterium]|nr:NAD-dependent deacylase [Verrucomicrobiaceae bacterium]